MINPVAAALDAAVKQLNGPTGFATAFLLLSAVVSTAVLFLQADKPKTLSGFVRFMAPTNSLTQASARADVLLRISRKLLMWPMAVPTGAPITVACSCTSHAASAAAFGDARHVSDRQTSAFGWRSESKKC